MSYALNTGQLCVGLDDNESHSQKGPEDGGGPPAKGPGPVGTYSALSCL